MLCCAVLGGGGRGGREGEEKSLKIVLDERETVSPECAGNYFSLNIPML